MLASLMKGELEMMPLRTAAAARDATRMPDQIGFPS
jgi:hypothetical protein